MRVLFPEPAIPYSHRTRCWLSSIDAQSSINLRRSALVPSRHSRRKEASISTGFSFSSACSPPEGRYANYEHTDVIENMHSPRSVFVMKFMSPPALLTVLRSMLIRLAFWNAISKYVGMFSYVNAEYEVPKLKTKCKGCHCEPSSKRQAPQAQRMK